MEIALVQSQLPFSENQEKASLLHFLNKFCWWDSFKFQMQKKKKSLLKKSFLLVIIFSPHYVLDIKEIKS